MTHVFQLIFNNFIFESIYIGRTDETPTSNNESNMNAMNIFASRCIYCQSHCFNSNDISVNEWRMRNWCFVLVSRSINFPVTESNNGFFSLSISLFFHFSQLHSASFKRIHNDFWIVCDCNWTMLRGFKLNAACKHFIPALVFTDWRYGNESIIEPAAESHFHFYVKKILSFFSMENSYSYQQQQNISLHPNVDTNCRYEIHFNIEGMIS